MLPLGVVGSIAHPHEAIAHALTVGVEHERPRDRRERRQGRVKLAALRGLLTVDGPGPRSAALT
eukprot:8330434-Lingulodinium_polyedra.AAC.1